MFIHFLFCNLQNKNSIDIATIVNFRTSMYSYYADKKQTHMHVQWVCMHVNTCNESFMFWAGGQLSFTAGNTIWTELLCKKNIQLDGQTYLTTSQFAQYPTFNETPGSGYDSFISTMPNKSITSKVSIWARWPIRPRLISTFSSIKWLEVLLLPPGWDATSQRPPPPCIKFTSTHSNPSRGGVSNWGINIRDT